jgi:thiol-disulfide isomerase/thioredoxin
MRDGTLIQNARELNEILKTKKKLFILFYASWCPHSLRFLPIFERWAKETKHSCYKFIIDEDEDICEPYSINVYPTVLFFENGAIKKRLDGIHGIGLNEKQFQELLNTCEQN